MDATPRWRLISAAVTDRFSSPAPSRIPSTIFSGLSDSPAGCAERAATSSVSRVTNARVLRVESSYAVQHLLPPASVEVFHLLFPDPWPKRRHWRRRVVTNDFLSRHSSSARSARHVPDRDGSNGLLPGNRAPGFAIRPLCHQARIRNRDRRSAPLRSDFGNAISRFTGSCSGKFRLRGTKSLPSDRGRSGRAPLRFCPGAEVLSRGRFTISAQSSLMR